MFSKTLLANKTHQILLVRKGFFASFRFPRFFQVLTQTSKIIIKNYQNRWKKRLKICKLTKFKGDSPKRVKILLQKVEKVKKTFGWLLTSKRLSPHIQECPLFRAGPKLTNHKRFQTHDHRRDVFYHLTSDFTGIKYTSGPSCSKLG